MAVGMQFPERVEDDVIGVGHHCLRLKIAFARVVDRARALTAFEEFFLGRARRLYSRYDFARMNDDEFGAALALD